MPRESPMPSTETPPHEWLNAALDRYERPLLSYAYGLCGDREEARDAVQDTFIKLSREATRINPDKVASWLFTVCRNRINDYFRKNHRLVPMDTEIIDREPSSVPAPSETLEEKETSRRISQWIKELPERQQELIRLKFQAGLSYKEIAQATRLSIGNIGYLIHCGVSTLRERWQTENAS
jgi:RNA polymerase sigma-70 factor (ECF subfamily)